MKRRIGTDGYRIVVQLACVIVLLLLCPLPADAYAGPGAGFAILSSFWAVFLAFLYSAYAFLTWPFRFLARFVRYRRAYGKLKSSA